MPIQHAARCAAKARPILIVSGTDSKFEAIRLRKLYEAAGENAELWEVPEAGHSAAWSAWPDEYKNRMLTFFADSLLEVGD